MTLTEQNALKPSYDSYAPLVLDAQKLAIMQPLIDYIGELKSKPRWYATNAYNVKYKGKMVFRFSMHDNNLHIYFTVARPSRLDGVLAPLAPDLLQFYFKNLRSCRHCNPAHGDGRTVYILGKEYKVCAEAEMFFANPTAEDIANIIAFVDVRRADILHEMQG